MKHPNVAVQATMLASMLALLTSPANADLIADAHVYPAHQVAVGPTIKIGLAVNASTSLPAIWASAQWGVACSEPKIRPPISGGRAFSNNAVVGPRQIVVTSPDIYPSVVGLSGWQDVPGGAYFDCNFSWFAAAKSGFLPVGTGGAAIPLGGDSWEKSGLKTIGMLKPGSANGGTCFL